MVTRITFPTRVSLLVVLGLMLTGCFIDLNADDAADEPDSVEASVSLMLHSRSQPDPESAHSADVPTPADSDVSGALESGETVNSRDGQGGLVSAWVTIDGIYLQGGHAEDDEDTDDAGRLWLTQESHTTNLLTLSNDVASLVDGATVHQGSYEQLRFVISGGYIEVESEDGSTAIYATSPDYVALPEGAAVHGELRMPSFATSGLKVDLPEDAFVIEGEQKIVLVDFDVTESFGRLAGRSDAWVMEPVLHATDVQFTSTVEVEAWLGANASLPEIDGVPMTMADIEVTLTDAEANIRSATLAEIDGDPAHEAIFEFVSPLQNPYSIDLRSDLPVTLRTDPAQPFVLDVPSGEIIVYGFEIVAVDVPPSSIEVEAALDPSVELPTVDGQQVTLADIDVLMADGDGVVTAMPLSSIDDDTAYEAFFDGVDATNGPYIIDFASSLDVVVESDPYTPYWATPVPGEAAVYSFVIDELRPRTEPPSTARVEVEALLDTGVALPEVDGQAVTLSDIEVSLTDASGDTRLVSLAARDDDAAYEAMFEQLDPAAGPYAIDFVSSLGLSIETAPATPYALGLEGGDDLIVSFAFTSVTAPAPGTARLVVQLAVDETVEVPQDTSLSDFGIVLSNEDGATGEASFVEVDAAFSLIFEDLDPAKTWTLDLTTPSWLTVSTEPAFPYTVQLAPGETTVVDVSIQGLSVTF